MIIKEGASIQGLHISMREVLIHAEILWKLNGRPKGVTITSGTEDVAHSPGSYHPYGLALDFRTRYFDDKLASKVANALRDVLPPGFDVILESDHIHVENDRLAKQLIARYLE